jgi:glycosyltransferase involved in cell wall biosynthesis
MTKLHYVVNEDWAFISHFLERAVAAKANGYAVAVSAHCGEKKSTLTDAGLEVFPHHISRSGTNPIIEMRNLFKLIQVFRQSKPDIIHLIALKPIVIGALAARIYGRAQVVCAPIGMGYLFSSGDRKARVIRPMVQFLLRRILHMKNTHVIIENAEDLATLVNSGFVKQGNISLIKGAGVNLDAYPAIPENCDTMIVSMFARVLRDKGVLDFLAAAKFVRKAHPRARFRLIGDCDPGNPTSFSQSEVESWVATGAIEWLGYRTDVPSLLAESNVVCLPSYREGLPKTLIEACAAQRAVVATDVTGCREAVEHSTNGLLVPVQNPVKLAEAISQLLDDKELRLDLAKNGRRRAETEFSSTIVISETLNVYNQLVGKQ